MDTDKSIIPNLLAKVDAESPEVGPVVRRVLEDFPEYTKNVFIMMRFRSTPQFDLITRVIRQALQKYGLWGIRADDKAYSDDLWLNVRAYMWACGFGVAVFEDIDERDFNPNVALEYGFMMALGKRVLLLKEERMPRLPADITGKLWKPFSIFEIESSITRQIDLFAVDVGLSPINTNVPTYIPPISLAPMIKEALLYQLESYQNEPRYRDNRDRSALLNLESEIRQIDTARNPADSLEQLSIVYMKLTRLLETTDLREVDGLLRMVDR